MQKGWDWRAGETCNAHTSGHVISILPRAARSRSKGGAGKRKKRRRRPSLRKLQLPPGSQPRYSPPRTKRARVAAALECRVSRRQVVCMRGFRFVNSSAADGFLPPPPASPPAAAVHAIPDFQREECRLPRRKLVTRYVYDLGRFQLPLNLSGIDFER